MPFFCTGLPRSERLLPLESIEVLNLTDSFLLHILSRQSGSDGDTGDGDCHSKRLREHLSRYRDQPYAYALYQRKLLRKVQSTRGPVRFADFPHVRTDPTGTHVPPPGPWAPASDRAQSSGAGPSANDGSFITSQPSAEAATTASSPPGSVEATLPPPRSLAAWNWISLVAPYERLLCPSLLYSALLSPSVGGCTSFYYSSQHLSPAPDTASMATAAGHARARWSTHTCQSMWALHSVAAEVSIPVQEVYVLCAGTIMYLDVVLTAGMVWSELEGMWGDELIFELEKEAANIQTHVPGSSETETGTQLSSLKLLLSQPPPTYAAVLQHVRVLLEALTRTFTDSKSTNMLSAREAVNTALPRPLVPWLEAAMKEEKWTASANTWANCSSCGGDAGSVTERILRYAVAECLSRRGATVTASTPTGSRAVPLPPRDLCLPRGSDLSASSPRKLGVCPACASACVGPSVRCAGGHRQCVTTARSAGAVTAASSILFEPFEPHDTARDRHPFFLPPLPQDPPLIFLTVVWRRTLQRCILEPDVLRQRLRQVILGYAGQRCEELLREAKQHSLQPRPLVRPSTMAESREGPPSSEALAGHIGMMGKTGAAANSALPVASLSSSTASPAATVPSPPLLLTCDPTATSFRVLGPRVGEWLTSSRGGGGWSGFRGELFYCVGPPLPPLVYSPSMSCPRATQARRHSPSSRGAPSSAAASAPPAKVLTEMFVDGALQVDRAGGVSTASSATPASRLPPLLYSVEELADRLCRLGAVLPRYATEVCGDQLRPADSDFVREVLQRHCLPLLLACERRGIQQWSLRSWMKGITLTLLDNSGAESRVITPVKLVGLGLQQARSVRSSNVFGEGTALRMVMDGGLSEALAFLEHVQKRPERAVRRLPVRRLVGDRGAIASDGASVTAAASFHYIATAVDVLLLRRAEESALFRIFQSHPSAPLLDGCGVQRLALPVTAAPGRRHEGGSGHLHPPVSSVVVLVRTCGVAVDWDLQDCYERPRFCRLREPRRLVSHSHREGTASGGTQWLPLPPELGTSVERVSLQHMRRMLQYYLRSLVTTAELTGASGTASGVPLASGVKRSRTDLEDEGVERPREPLSIGDAGHADYEAGVKSSVSLPLTDVGSASAARTLRTTVFPIDRAALLYVLRHHPQYHREVKGCGVKQVYVAAATLSSEESVAVAARAKAVLDGTGALAVAATISADPSSSTAAGPCRAVVIVERVCGQSVEVDLEACYDKAREGRPLRPFVMPA